MIKAIETQYKGYRFRSRLEARWAVFFDALGLNWAYETEGFDLGELGWYLPDFWIDWGTDDAWWIEIKAHANLSEREIGVAVELSQQWPGFVLLGTPTPPTFAPQNEKKYRGSWAIPFLKTISQSIAAGPASADIVDPRMYCWHERDDGTYLLWPVPAQEANRITRDELGVFMDAIKEGRRDGFIAFTPELGDIMCNMDPLGKSKWIDSESLIDAYTAARSARFEHGENGTRRHR